MKMTMKVLVIITAMAFSACNEKKYAGTLKLQQSIQLIDKDKKPVSLEAGEMNAQFKAAKKDRVDIEFRQGSKKITVPVKVNFSLKDIQSGTHINVTPQISGQKYTLTGDYQVNTVTTPPTRGTESCSYEYNHRQVCDWRTIPGYCTTESEPERCQYVTECDPNNPNQCKTRAYNCTGGGTREVCHPSREEQSCRTESDTYHGHHEVTRSTTTTTKYYTLDILDNGQNLGRIQFGDRDYSTHVYDETPCR